MESDSFFYRLYEDLLQSNRVKRIFLDQLPKFEKAPLSLGILHLLSAPMSEAQKIAPQLLQKAKVELAGSDLEPKAVQLVEELLIRRFSQFTREEIRMKFKLHPIRETRVWKEGVEEGKKELIEKLLAKGMSPKQISELLDMSVEEVQQLLKNEAP